MSFFSLSSGRRPYQNPHYGSGHYQKRGILDKLGSFMGSFSSGRRGYYPPGYQQNQGYPPQGQPGQQPLSQQTAPQSNLFCKSCGANVPAGSKFCLQCGAKMNAESVCPGCGQPIPPDARFCPGCGAQRK